MTQIKDFKPRTAKSGKIKTVTINKKLYVEQRNTKGRFIARIQKGNVPIQEFRKRASQTGSIRPGETRTQVTEKVIAVEKTGARKAPRRGEYQYFVKVRYGGKIITRTSEKIRHQSVKDARQDAYENMYSAIDGYDTGDTGGDIDIGKQKLRQAAIDKKVTFLGEGIVQYATA